MNLLHEPQWSLFYDFHTMPACPDVGASFDADLFTDRVKACGVDFIVFPAKCNLGMAYYDTKVGTRHPSLQYDLFGRLAERCQAKGIALSAYINVGLSHEDALLRREWCVVSPEGYIYQPDRLNSFFRSMCYNTGYAEHIVEMVREVVTGYPISGLFLDCIGDFPCVGVECVREMKERGIDWTDVNKVREFARFSSVRLAGRIAQTAQAIKPGLLLWFNGIPFEQQMDICTYMEFECLPTGHWGYEYRPVYARYLRTLGKEIVINMSGSFHKSWGDFGGIRTQASLEYDCLDGLANAMRLTIGNHLHPRGDINHAAFDLEESIYTRLQKLQPWLTNASALSDAALVLPGTGYRNCNKPEVRGAARMLCELKVQFDVISDVSQWKPYKILVLPDRVLLDETRAARIREHLDRGCAILSSAWSGLDPEGKAFVFEEWGVRFQGDDPFDPAFIRVEPEFSEGVPDMPLTLYERGTAVEALKGTQVLAYIVAPYYNRVWDGEHGFMYLPPDRVTDRPAITLHGNVGHISHPIFTTYYEHAPVPLRQILRNLLGKLLPNPLVITDGMPSFARATVTAQPNRRMVHLLSYVPERRGPNTDMIEEPIELRKVRVRLRVDDRELSRCYLAPSEEQLPFSIKDGYAETIVPVVPGYAMVVFE